MTAIITTSIDKQKKKKKTKQKKQIWVNDTKKQVFEITN